MGMGRELYDSSPAARKVFEATDSAMGLPLTRLMFEGPAEELQRTINSQPAIMVVSLACLRATEETLEQELPFQPAYMAGHSLGEYTALVASGALSFEDGLRLVRERGRLMQEASDLVPSGMAAIIGLDEATVKAICQEAGVQVANINSPEQTVISGEKTAVARAIDLATARGAGRVVPLRVSGAFHSELMRPAMEGMLRAMGEIRFRNPRVPVVANTTGEPLASGDGVKDELAQQLCSCVHWKRSVEFMVGGGVTRFLEIGPGGVLTGLVRRINPEVQATAVKDMDSIRRLAD